VYPNDVYQLRNLRRCGVASERQRRKGEVAALSKRTMALGVETFGAKMVDGTPEALIIGLIDSHVFSRECLVRVFQSLGHTVVPFESLWDCIHAERHDLEIIIYHIHSQQAFDPAVRHDIAALAGSFPDAPTMVFSDAENPIDPRAIRSTVSSGARGFVATRSVGVSVADAAVRFVRAGGTFAPFELLLTSTPEQAPPTEAGDNRFTARQMAVLAHLRQGKANKSIAYELHMSESTVKVHVRNIMRKLGATNRTQVVYMIQKMWSMLRREESDER
jgi:DNA-binding NarL/FixJ family response regulator